MSEEQWRLLNKEEVPQRGDECCVVRDEWSETGNAGIRQADGYVYCRKIEQPKPLVWAWGKTDKQGIWAFGGHDPQPALRVVRGVPGLDLQSNDDGWVCYLGPIPTIELPPKKYREPVLPADHGKECEFSFDANFSTVRLSLLLGFNKLQTSDENPWRCEIGYYRFARIEVTE